MVHGWKAGRICAACSGGRPGQGVLAVTIYDVLTRSKVKNDTMKAGVPSNDKLNANADGSTARRTWPLDWLHFANRTDCVVVRTQLGQDLSHDGAI
jgi:hypothetical protein